MLLKVFLKSFYFCLESYIMDFLFPFGRMWGIFFYFKEKESVSATFFCWKKIDLHKFNFELVRLIESLLMASDWTIYFPFFVRCWIF